MQYNKSNIYFTFMTEVELKKEFLSLSNYENELPQNKIDAVYVFSGVEKNRLIGSSLDRLKAGIEIWEKLSVTQKRPPIFLFQGSAEWYYPVKQTFDKGQFYIPDPFLRLELVKSWKSTLDQFLQIPTDLKSLKNWLIVTSFWHLPRTKHYAKKWWTEQSVYYWATPFDKNELNHYMTSEINKIIKYSRIKHL